MNVKIDRNINTFKVFNKNHRITPNILCETRINVTEQQKNLKWINPELSCSDVHCNKKFSLIKI